MKKSILTLSLIITTTLVLSGCGSPRNQENQIPNNEQTPEIINTETVLNEDSIGDLIECNEDEICAEELILNCTPGSYLVEDTDMTIKTTIKGTDGENCLLEQVNINSTDGVSSVKCTIPTETMNALGDVYILLGFLQEGAECEGQL